MGIRDDSEETARIGSPVIAPEDRHPSDWRDKALSDEMIKTAELSRRIGFALVIAREILGIAQEQEEMQIRGGFTQRRSAERMIKILETGNIL